MHIILHEKMCEYTQIFYVKCEAVGEYSYEKCEWCWLWCQYKSWYVHENNVYIHRHKDANYR